MTDFKQVKIKYVVWNWALLVAQIVIIFRCESNRVMRAFAFLTFVTTVVFFVSKCVQKVKESLVYPLTYVSTLMLQSSLLGSVTTLLDANDKNTYRFLFALAFVNLVVYFLQIFTNLKNNEREDKKFFAHVEGDFDDVEIPQ